MMKVCILCIFLIPSLGLRISSLSEAIGKVEQSPFTQKECPENGITAYGHRDGFGATYSAMIGVYMYAAITKRVYCTTRWDHESHGISMREMFDWVGGSELGPPATSKTQKIRHMLTWDPRTLIDNAEKESLLNNQVRRVRDAYFRSRHNDASINLFTATTNMELSKENVAWHIRRGDVDERQRVRYTSNAQIVQGLTALHVVRPIAVVHFFSEGKKKDFQDIIDVCVHLKIECKWHLNESVMATHYSLSIADVLVVAHSSFSASAGLLNEKIVLHEQSLLKPNITKLQPMDLQAKANHIEAIFHTKYVLKTN